MQYNEILRIQPTKQGQEGLNGNGVNGYQFHHSLFWQHSTSLATSHELINNHTLLLNTTRK